MKTMSLQDAQDRLAKLAAEVKVGENIVVTRNGKPVFQVEAQPKRKGIALGAGHAYLRSKGITNPVPFIADDFDAPLPEDFLLRPLP